VSLKIYFLRHGETSYSTTGAYCGEVDAELTPEGAQMARGFAETHRSIPWTAVYVSPMKRTIATAKPLCDALGLEMQLRDGLKEIRYGKWEDKSVDYVKQHYWDDYIHWLAIQALGADRAYDTDALRAALAAAPTPKEAVIPPRAHRRVAYPYDQEPYRQRNRVERLVGRLKQFRAVATRYDKLDAMFGGLVVLCLAGIALS